MNAKTVVIPCTECQSSSLTTCKRWCNGEGAKVNTEVEAAVERSIYELLKRKDRSMASMRIAALLDKKHGQSNVYVVLRWMGEAGKLKRRQYPGDYCESYELPRGIGPNAR